MYKRSLKKPDGRSLWLYGREPIPEGITAPSPVSEPMARSSHLRWHPLRSEWVAYATHRQDRTFLPPPEYNPLAPTVDPSQPTEVPAGAYDVAVFENLFPTLSPDPGPPPDEIVETVWAAMQEHVCAAHPDDRTLLIIRFECRSTLKRTFDHVAALVAGT